MSPSPVHDRRVLTVAPCAPKVLLALQRDARSVTQWSAPMPHRGFGEALVRDVMGELARVQPDVLITPAPDSSDPQLRSLALASVEAARRARGPVCAWPAPLAPLAPGAAQSASPTWTVLAADDLEDALPVLYRGHAAGHAAALLHEAPAPGAPLVSVIVRSMDRPSLQAALDSIVLQTYRPIEVVIVNALGATHRPLPLPSPLTSPMMVGDLTVVAVSDGSALPRARAANRGLSAAHGTLLALLDDDDQWLPDHLAKLVAALATAPEAVAAHSDVLMGCYGAAGWQTLHRFDSSFDPLRLRFENYLPIHAVLFRRAASPADFAYDEAFDLFEDWDFWLQLASRGRFVHVPGHSARYVTAHGTPSNVFEDTPLTRAARRQLYEKWRLRGSAAEHAALLERLQALHRAQAQGQAQLEMLRAQDLEQRAVLRARETEISHAAEQARALQTIASARDEEITNALAQITQLRGVLTARDREIADTATQIGALRSAMAQRDGEIAELRKVLAAREREIADALLHIAALGQVVQAREREITDLKAESTALRALLAARDDEIAARERALTDLRALAVAQDRALAVLQTEGTVQAVSRTLKTKIHAIRRRP